MEACTIKAHVKTPKGDIIESKLYNSLSLYLSTKKEANKYYSLSMSEKFRSELADLLEFDENGEPTFQTFIKAAEIDLDDKLVRKRIEKLVQLGTFDYNLAVLKMYEFNTKHELKDKYIIGLELLKNGLYKTVLQERNEENIRKLTKTLEDYQLVDRINSLLKEKLGVGVLFNLEGNFKGRYSTENAKQAADGLYYLVLVSKGLNTISDTLGEEAGHVVVGSLGETPLVLRLLELLKNPEVQKAVLGDEYGKKDLGSNPAREIAGDLVGKALINKLTPELKKHETYSLVKRIVDYAKKIFSKLAPNLVSSLIELAKLAADLIVEGFLSPNYTGTVENNLLKKETLYSKSTIDHLSEPTDSFIKAVATFKRMYDELEAYKLDASKNDMLKKLSVLTSLNSRTPDLIALTDLNELKRFAYKYLLDVVAIAYALAEEIGDESSRQDNILSSYDNVSVLTDAAELEVFKLLNRYLIVDKAVSNIASIISAFSNAREGSILVYDNDGNLINLNFDRPLKELLNLCNETRNHLNNWTRRWFLKYLEKVYGANYIRQSAKVVFGHAHYLDYTQPGSFENYARNKEGYYKGHWGLIRGLYRTSLTDVPLDIVLSGKGFQDITLYGAWLSAMSDCGDPVLSILKLAIDKANREKLRQTENDRKTLDALYNKLVATTHNGDTSRFFKRVKNKINGYLLAPFDYGKWEKAKQKREKELTEAFYNDLLDLYGGDKSLVQAYRIADPLGFASLLQAYVGDKMKEWHKQNSHYQVIDKKNHVGRYIPNIDLGRNDGKVDYTDLEFKNLSAAELQWLLEYFDWKRNKEKVLEGGAVEWRAPLHKGTLGNMAKNQNGNIVSRWGKAVWDNFKYYLPGHLNEEDKWSWGLEHQTDELENALYDENMNIVEDINRLPMLGVRLRKNLDELNTNLIASSYLYSYMVNNFAALKNITNVALVGADVLKKQRAVGGELDVDSHALSAYYRNVNRSLYNRIPSSFFGKNIDRRGMAVAGKLLGLIKVIGTEIALAWNPNPAVVNVGTGFIEIEKEAYAGEFYNYADLMMAHKLYTSSRLSNLKSAVTGDVFLNNDGDISKFLMYFDCLNNYGERIAKSRKNKFMRVASSLPFAMYSLGDHYMLGIPFLAMAVHLKLYDTKDKKWVNLTEIYKTTYKQTKVGQLKIADYGFEEQRYAFYENALEVHNNLTRLKNSLDDILDGDNIIDGWKRYLTTNELYLRPILEEIGVLTKGQNIMEVKKSIPYLLEILKRAEDKLFWNTDHEDKFVSRARNVCNRLHGIYSNIDKVNAAGHPYGAAVLSMRGYALGMLERRFSSNYFNAVLGLDVEGSYVSMAKMILDSEVGPLTKLVEILLPIGVKNFKEELKKANYDDNQIANIARSRADLYRFAILWGLSHLLLGMLLNSVVSGDNPDDDIDEESLFWDEINYTRWKGFLYYLAYKLTREQGAFMLPSYMLSEVGSLGSFTPMGVGALWSFGNATVDLLKYGYRFYFDKEWFKYPDREAYEDDDEGEAQYQEDLKKARARNRKMWGTTKDIITAAEEGEEKREGVLYDAKFWDSLIRKKWSTRSPFPDKLFRKIQDYKKNVESDKFQRQINLR